MIGLDSRFRGNDDLNPPAKTALDTALPKAYEPHDVERGIRLKWEAADCFRADPASKKSPFCMVIPPPNVTGSLHMGHALNNTLQDILARYKRMDGFEVLWLPGTDHAGIATQNVVERELAKEGVGRRDLGREKFLERVWKWKETYGGRILEQLRRLGCSCDFSRTRFTMDEGLSNAVREVFVRLWEEKLLYRGDYIVNWCPRCGTALSDIEVNYREIDGAFYHVQYPFTSGEGGVVVATTRPETMLGDTAVAVHPDDDRHRALVGRTVRLPIVNREIPILADSYVDPSFGTGLVKITPAHDPNDFLVGQRHNLPLVNILNPDATLNESAGPFAGQDRFEARRGVVERLQAEGLLVRIEQPYRHSVGHCYRCSTPIEPYVSKQWFIRMKPLAEPAIAAVKDGRIRLHPEKWKTDYLQWMENIRDWCVSRQIWWGHRIPAWYCSECGGRKDNSEEGIIVSREEPRMCPACGSTNLRRDEDVLDTWFSSALWPFSTLGWPEETPELKKFYPTSVLSTGFDILTFWVSRMIVMGLHVMKREPFKDVPIHALVRTETGEKMSKSKGNVIDPLVMMDKYGTDAVRFTLAALAAQGRDIKLSEQRFEGYRHFANKLWNATRFVMMNLGDPPPSQMEGNPVLGFPESGASGTGHPCPLPPEFAPRPVGHPLGDPCAAWILRRLDAAVRDTRAALDAYEFDAAARRLYDFIWGEYCDWYIEISKIFLMGGDTAARDQARAALGLILAECLKLLHPFMPFVTEEIWAHLPGGLRQDRGTPGIIALTDFPRAGSAALRAFEPVDERLSTAIDLIRQIRNIRALYRVPPNQTVTSLVRMNRTAPGAAADEAFLRASGVLFERLCRSRCDFRDDAAALDSSASCAFPSFTVHVGVGEFIDLEKERSRLRGRLDEIAGLIRKNEARLADSAFLDNAPEEIVEGLREKTENLRLEKAQLAPHLG
ncbi:valine--tRNA ligase [bacterium]|nr:valine--tRNA ligase [bacterium]